MDGFFNDLGAGEPQRGQRRRLDTAGVSAPSGASHSDSTQGELRQAVQHMLRTTAANCQAIHLLNSAVFLTVAIKASSPITKAVLAAGQRYAELAKASPGKHGSPHRQTWHGAAKAAQELAQARGHSGAQVLLDHLSSLATPSDVCKYVPQLYKKAWNNFEAKKRNPEHEDMFNLFVSSTPAGRPIVEAFVRIAVEIEGATAHEGTAPPTAQEQRLQDFINKMNK